MKLLERILAIISSIITITAAIDNFRCVDVEVRSGDSLAHLAKDHLGNEKLWPIIWDTNRDVIGSNPNRVKVGKSLKIPALASLTRAERHDAMKRTNIWKDYPHRSKRKEGRRSTGYGRRMVSPG